MGLGQENGYYYVREGACLHAVQGKLTEKQVKDELKKGYRNLSKKNKEDFKKLLSDLLARQESMKNGS